MNPLFFGVIVAVLIAGFAGIFFFLKKQQKPEGKGDDKSLLLLQNQVAEVTRMLDTKLGESSRVIDAKLAESMRAMQHQSSESAKIIRDVTERLTRLDETNKQVVNFADQLKNLQDILKNPKQRGVLGEYYLETVLKNVLPPGTYQMQYPFKDGVIVDAVVIIDKRIIPIDSKFSLENYNRILESALGSPERKKYESAFIADLKTRIDETSKYVKPAEGTMDFAFMFIPSEAVYYDLLINKVGAVQDETRNLVSYAGEKHVIIVSPTSFLAYLQTVLQGLKNQKISEQTKEIIKHVVNLTRHLKVYDDYFEKIGKNLSNTVGAYNHAYKEFAKIDKDVLKISGESAGITPELVEGPTLETEEEENVPRESSRLL
jgi:DNA recombination protein RmuC